MRMLVSMTVQVCIAWGSLSATAEEKSICSELARSIPQRDAPLAPGSAFRVLTFEDDQPVWEGKPIHPEDAIPE